MSAAYFIGYTPRNVDLGSLPDDQKPAQADPDCLPFGQLGGRRFEILCYKIKRAIFSERSVALMQGTGDGGRDVVLYEHGRVVEIVQCKNTRERLSVAKLLEELAKLALYHVAQDEILQNGVKYEIWAPAGLLPSRLANGTAPRLDDGHLAVARQGLSAPMGIESVAPTPHGAMGILPATARCGESMAIVDLTRLGPRG